MKKGGFAAECFGKGGWFCGRGFLFLTGGFAKEVHFEDRVVLKSWKVPYFKGRLFYTFKYHYILFK